MFAPEPLIGHTDWTDFPTTPNAFQRFLPGYESSFVAKFGDPPASVRISGRALWNGAGLGGVTLTLRNGAGTVVRTTTTSSNGNYALNAPGGGDYTLTPSKPEYKFEPLNLNYTRIGTNWPMQDFEAIPTTIRISGRVLWNGAGLGGVTVSLSSGSASIFQSVTTSSDGSYSFSGPGGNDYKITPNKANFKFNPLNLTYPRVVTDLTMQNFDAISIMIQVTVSGINGIGRQGVRLDLSGTNSATCTTDLNGLCAFAGLSADGVYRITPSKDGATFNPTSKTFNRPGSDQVVIFKETYTISGQVVGLNGIGIGGITVKMRGDLTTYKITDDRGNYRFTGLLAGGNYTVTPSRGGMTFNPVFTGFNNLNAPGTAGFQALVSITGKVRLQGTTTGIGGVTMNLTGSRSVTATTGTDGLYTFTNLPAGGNYTVTPSRAGYTFTPSSRTFTNLRANAGSTSTYFDGRP